ncbi:hydrolase CocE/NonD family protein [Ophiobolus disseminans]|uniref:Hydrolase CocE/NonD family protein n=1 Tax=Ophiobolus disseminans TaxID=1469910 RepID=A0A6A7AA91_9PLEO|nr:hydrolase CocE/NonD family protein [Ophiobolus disseminans]
MATKRSLVTTLVDRLGHRQLGFPPETCSYTVTEVRIPVSNQTEQFELMADLYQPVLSKNAEPAGTVLVRCPYGRSPALSFLGARPYAARGYVCLLVSCRGTFGSGAVFDPFRNEEQDGHAVVEWMRKQAWYTGTFATLGGSYLGFVQYALLKNPPTDMVAAIIQCAPHDFGKQLWGTGSLTLDFVAWGENVAHQGETGLLHTLNSMNTAKRMRPVLDRTPLAESIKSHFDGRAPWLDFVVDHHDLSDPYYEQMNLSEALERADIPILLVSGWYDLFAPQTMEQYAQLSQRKTNVALTVGAWNHMNIGMSAKVWQQTFDWLEEHLAKRKSSTRKSAVQYFVTGAEVWRDWHVWPPSTIQRKFYVQSSNKLDESEPTTDEGSSSFTFDPQQPTPTKGGNLLLGGGRADDTALAARPDVLTLTTEPLKENIEVCGKITVDLSHSSDNPNVDLFVRISEVNAKGRSQSVTDTYLRLKPDRDSGPVFLQLRDCAHQFAKGNRIRLIVAGASHPQYAIIPEKAVHTIHHGKTGVSKVSLPCTT